MDWRSGSLQRLVMSAFIWGGVDESHEMCGEIISLICARSLGRWMISNSIHPIAGTMFALALFESLVHDFNNHAV